MSDNNPTIENTELTRKARRIFSGRIHKFDLPKFTVVQDKNFRNKKVIIAPYDKTVEKIEKLISQEILSNLNRIMKAGQVAAIDGTDHDIVVAVEKTIDAEKAKYTNLGGSE